MNCMRCNGLAVNDDSFAIQTGSSSNFHGWRCVNCGMIVDDVIQNNKRVLQRSRRSRDSERRREAA